MRWMTWMRWIAGPTIRGSPKHRGQPTSRRGSTWRRSVACTTTSGWAPRGRRCRAAGSGAAAASRRRRCGAGVGVGGSWPGSRATRSGTRSAPRSCASRCRSLCRPFQLRWSWSDATGAGERGWAGPGLAAGGRGVANIWAAFASAGRVGVYAKVWVGQRFLARANDEVEGAYFIGSAGPGRACGVASGAGVGRRSARTSTGALGFQPAQPSRAHRPARAGADLCGAPCSRDRGWTSGVGSAWGEITAIGQRYGGQRLHGRATAELAWKLRAGLRAPFAALLLVYEGGQIVAGPSRLAVRRGGRAPERAPPVVCLRAPHSDGPRGAAAARRPKRGGAGPTPRLERAGSGREGLAAGAEIRGDRRGASRGSGRRRRA